MLHAEWRDHAYPGHTHDTWTLLLVDDGLIGYNLDRRAHAAVPRAGVTLLPPHVVHDGRPATSRGFRKRVVYLDGDVFAETLIGSAADGPMISDDRLRVESSLLDQALVLGEDLEAESRLALVVERLAWHLTGRPDATVAQDRAQMAVARRAREVLDDDSGSLSSIAAVAQTVGVSTAHLVRSFTRSYGIPPHQYVLGRRLDVARRRLLAGEAPVDVALATGFHDQSHLTRHFKRLLAITPGRYQRGVTSSHGG
ncbi:AraC family transcriptional regulator [Acidiferrimicrobium sp. IK]|uniref:helix-turn-helix transcriptional regulator n=1 Tax=Acidiferrimicrobium sp. IK TaxID=2871700 RepID=UPI0021CB841F|nr:AraC family transcriptional regulator [Acidiferrimicrobium sp. IK]MCU4187307.1 AraC family transcriptional regulator [Acidiferrimicrobium sp. IK]